MGAAAAIQARELSAGYGDREVLRSVSFDVARHRTCVVVGPGGSGKSTLLSLMRRTGGEVTPWVRGHLAVPEDPPRFLPQSGLPPDRTLSELLPADVAPAIDLVADFWSDIPQAAAALTSVLDLPLGRLPVWQRRLAEFTVIASHPDAFLLLDEPDARVDGPALEWIGAKIRENRHRQTTVVVTHHLAFARVIADYVLLLVDGVLVEAADADDFFERPVHSRTRDFVRLGC
jgi:ABC-type phosphate transport system ATPase subunit